MLNKQRQNSIPHLHCPLLNLSLRGAVLLGHLDSWLWLLVPLLPLHHFLFPVVSKIPKEFTALLLYRAQQEAGKAQLAKQGLMVTRTMYI